MPRRAIESRIDREARPESLLLVACWCGENYCWLSPRDVRAGRTEACRLPGCVAPDEAMT